MSKYKLISLIAGVAMVSGMVMYTGAVSNKTANMNNKISNTVLLAAPINNGNKGVVINTNKSPLVLYKNANSNGTIVSYISVGEMLNVESTGSNFYKVTVEETGATGYISVNNIQLITSGVGQAYTPINKQGEIINVDSDVYLRANATMNSNKLASLKNSTNINVLGKQGSWYKVNVNGTIGYIYQSYVGIDSSANNIDSTSNTSQTNNINKKFTISEKAITSNGTVIVPEKIIYSGNTYNSKDIQEMKIPEGYKCVKVNVYNNGNMVETGNGSQLNLPNENHIKSGTVSIDYIVEKVGGSAINNSNENNALPKDLSTINVSAGQDYTALGVKANEMGISVPQLRELAFNAIKNKVPNSGYINLTQEQKNILTNGTQAQKTKLVDELGPDKLLINVTYNTHLPMNTSSVPVYPQNFGNGHFYYDFVAAPLSKMAESVNNWATYSGMIDTDGQLLSPTKYNELCNAKSMYILNVNSGIPSYRIAGQLNI